MNVKKLFLLNLPYLLFVYPFDMERRGKSRAWKDGTACIQL